MSNKKTVSFVMAAVMAVAALFSFTACAPKAPEVTGIEITTAPTKVEYVLGEKFNPAGMVVSKTFDDKSKTALTADEYTWDLKGELKLNDKKVTISYKTEDKTFTADVKIKVTNDVASVEIVTQPTKTDYIAGEKFNPEGMTIRGVLQNGDKEEAFAVTEDVVTYKTTALVKSDEHFKMNYGGVDFYLDMTVVHGAFLEAEDGQVKGATIASQGPSKNAIDMDYDNAPGNKSDGQGHRGIDEGKNCVQIRGEECYKGGANGCTIEGTRVDIRTYVYNNLALTETTGGTPAKSGMMQNNHVNFTKGSKMLYKLTADKAGKVIVTFKMANPNIVRAEAGTYSAPETALSQVIKLTVGTTEVTIPATSKFAAVDWSAYKAYNKDADFENRTDSTKYTGKYCIPTFAWQNVAVEITVKEGVNDLTVESLWEDDVKMDSISCNADADEITISLNSEFKPVVTSAQLKVKESKVLLGVIVDAQAVGYTDEEIVEFLGLTKASMSNATYNGNVLGGKLENGEAITANTDTNDPWTQRTDNGGLGYTQVPYAVNMEGNGTKVSYKDDMGGKGNVDSVEKITEGKFAGMFMVWFDVTIPATNSDNYVGVWTFSNFNYGTDFTDSKPDQDIIKTDENVTAELGGYCYQAYCDNRDDNVTFGWGNLCLVVQKGSFEGEGACNKLMRRWISHWTADRNDQELADLRKEPATEA